MNVGCQIFWHILQETMGGKGIKFKQRAIHHYWAQIGSDIWWLANDPIGSAHKYCQKHGPGQYIEEVEMHPIPGSQAFAFVVKDFMAGWAQHTNSFSVDLTCK